MTDSTQVEKLKAGIRKHDSTKFVAMELAQPSLPSQPSNTDISQPEVLSTAGARGRENHSHG